jgi:hypothetical protein
MEVIEVPPSPLFIVIALEPEPFPTQDTAPDPLFINIDLEDDALPSPQVAGELPHLISTHLDLEHETAHSFPELQPATPPTSMAPDRPQTPTTPTNTKQNGTLHFGSCHPQF